MLDLIVYCLCQQCFNPGTLKMLASDLSHQAQKMRGRISVPRLQRRNKLHHV